MFGLTTRSRKDPKGDGDLSGGALLRVLRSSDQGALSTGVSVGISAAPSADPGVFSKMKQAEVTRGQTHSQEASEQRIPAPIVGGRPSL